MKKIFRMKYEPCKGACYSPGQEFFHHLFLLRNDTDRLKHLMTSLVKIHQPLCGNENLAYAIDYDEENKLYIGSFARYGELELVSDTNAVSCMEKLVDIILSENLVDESDHSVCDFGDDKGLLKFVVDCAKIPTPQGMEKYLLDLGVL